MMEASEHIEDILGLELLIIPDERLRNKAQPVSNITPEILALLDGMRTTMIKSNGVALAAIQVDIQHRMVVANLGYIRAVDKGLTDTLTPEELKQNDDIIFMINPKITWADSQTIGFEEGCLSIPGTYAEIERPRKINYQYMDINGKIHTVKEASGLESACIQHELDHLDGKLYTDYLDEELRQSIINAVQEYQKSNSV